MRPGAWLILKAGISVSILAVMLSRMSMAELLAPVRESQPQFLAAALAIAVLSLVLVALRWRMLAAWLGLALPAGRAVRALFVGVFGGQVLPSGIGTDLVRGWLVAGNAASVRRVVASLMADRLVALFAACLMLLLSTLAVRHPALRSAQGLALAAAAASGAILFAFSLWCSGALRPGEWLGVPRRLREIAAIDGVPMRLLPILSATAIALAVHGATVGMAALTARAYGVDASLGLWLAIVPMSIIASAIPVSINGWGVREATIVLLAAPMGVPAAQALLVSVTLGVLNMMASLPGAVLVLRGRAA